MLAASAAGAGPRRRRPAAASVAHWRDRHSPSGSHTAPALRAELPAHISCPCLSVLQGAEGAAGRSRYRSVARAHRRSSAVTADALGVRTVPNGDYILSLFYLGVAADKISPCAQALSRVAKFSGMFTASKLVQTGRNWCRSVFRNTPLHVCPGAMGLQGGSSMGTGDAPRRAFATVLTVPKSPQPCMLYPEKHVHVFMGPPITN